MQTRVVVALCSMVILQASLARAEDAPAAEAAAAAPAAAPPVATAVAQSGLRFRGGISLAGGMEKVSVVSGEMYGLDGRLGVQVNDLLGIYVQPHLSFGSLGGQAGGIGVTGATGTFSIAAMGEATFIDRLFAGAGLGYGVLNNPSGPMFQARAGGYLLETRGQDGIRRKGLMAGVDLRTIFINGATGVLVLASIGYEKF
jgi:hypothetical protein